MTLSRQEVFNRALYGVRAQDYKQSINENGYCAYRGNDGLKCGIGHCVDDDLAYLMDKGNAAGVTAIEFLLREDEEDFAGAPALRQIFHVEDAAFLSDVQSAHDGIGQNPSPETPQEAFEGAMEAIAERYNLEYTCP